MYGSVESVQTRIGEAELVALTDDESLGTVNTSRVESAITEADAVIDSYIGTRYSVPLSTVPALIAAMSAILTVCALYTRRAIKMPETWAEEKKTVLRQLADISKGTATLGIAVEPEARAVDSGAETNLDEDSQVFTREKMEGF